MARLHKKSLAPGPRGYPLLGSFLEFRRDVLGLMLRSMHAHGDVVRFRVGPLIVHLLCHPEHIQYVLKNHQNYDKNTRSSAMIKRATGESLLVSNGELWEQQRRLMQASFAPNRVAAFTDLMVAATTDMLARWRTVVERDEPLDVASEMMRLTYRIIEKSLFSTETSGGMDSIENAITVALQYTYRRVEKAVNIPEFIPTPRNLRFRKALKTLDRRVFSIIEEHRQMDQDSDLLSILMRAADDQTNRRMNSRQLRNEAITLLTAGHETTANALAWLWYLLSQHPEIEARVHEEVRDVLAGRTPTVEDLPRLTYTTMTINEAMRIYTPIWAIVRRVIEDDEIGGYHIPARSHVVISPYVTHRHPEFWEDPETFDPERFASQRFKNVHHYAYIPFGGGPRVCIGQSFAKTEALVITALVARSFRLRLVPGHRVEMHPGITLRTRHGLLMTAHQRE